MTVSPSSTAKKSKKIAPERHVLVIDNGNRRAISLDAAAYSIGRDPSNAIVLDTVTVSRKHAILLRLPIPGENRYRYRLIDGDSNGQPSANGVFVNQQRCNSHELVNGDIIGLGRKIQASYLTVTMEEAEFAQYLESIEFHSLKKSNLVDSRATLVADIDADSTGLSDAPHNSSSPEPDFKSTMIEEEPDLNPIEPKKGNLQDFIAHHRLKILLVSVLITTALGLAGKMASTQSQEQQKSSTLSTSVLYA
ncbi:Glycogen accumulation regulator GarA [Acaryochloris thomasi RCC1774]|uniref:Glycogen accumulation regulator GarA n=1 Tax=Acaryochloris thomasi RCC1774 TaxID=1764569 RepID=A0A2W1K6M0_9CYAN|nr:FHA domain-containing protein [Acaryochloris thomasi]PZD75247.1 Glycogen accumulation regulator GarA [Acaryochloris thomasi RCC1774]